MSDLKQGQSFTAAIQSSSIATRELVVAIPLGAAIVALPWLFGGVHTASQMLLAGCVLAAILVRVIAYSKDSGALPLALIPLVLAIGLGVVQQLPLGQALATVSPRSHSLWEASSIANTASEGALAIHVGELAASNNSTISLYPLSTRRDVILLVIAVAVFFLGSQLLSRRKWQRLFFGVVAANGAIFAFFGLAQQLVWNGQIYGRIPLTQGGRPFAAFVNSNNAGGYLNLCLAAAIGFTMYSFAHNDGASTAPSRRHREKWLTRAYNYASNELAHLNAQKLASLVMLILIFAGLLCTLSRGAWCSMLVSIVVVAVILAANKRVAYVAGTLLLVVVLGFGLVDWLGRTEAISARWELLQSQFTSPSDGRLINWPDGLRAGREFWLLGSGLGTYRYVYRPYAATDDIWFYHAENQYLESFCEGGVVGLGLLLTSIAMIAIACRTLLRDRNQERHIFGVVGTYALLSQAVHALFDFGLYMPANMALFALICGGVAGASTLQRRASGRWREMVANFARRNDLQAGFASLLVCGILLGVTDLNKCMAVETALKKSRISETYGEDSVASVTSQIRQLSSSLAKTSDHAEGQQRLARLWVHRFRLRSLAELAALAPEGTSHDKLWTLTAPLVVHEAVFRYAKEGRMIELENLRRSEPVQTDLSNAARALVQANDGCALLPRSHLLLAEIAPILSQDATTARWLASMPFLAGGNTHLLKQCAIAQMQAGQIDDAMATLRRTVEIAPAQLPEALQLATLAAEPEFAVRKIAPNSPHLLVRAASSDYFGQDDRMRDALLVQAKGLLQVAALDPADRNQLEGSIYALLKQDEQAVESLRKAVADRPEMTAWRYELASLLQKLGDVEGAWRHARTCVRMEPDNEQFDALLRQLNRTRIR